eukprot:4177914-Lingulodinium_polyedra.AAC.1
MRSNRPRATATARESHAHVPHARTNELARAWNAQTCDSRPAGKWNCLNAAWQTLGCCLGAAWVPLGCCS